LFSSYAVKFLATETVGGVAADKLELIPKSDRLRNNIARICCGSTRVEFRCNNSSLSRAATTGWRSIPISESTKSFPTTHLS